MVSDKQGTEGRWPGSKIMLGAQISGLTVDIQSKLHQIKRTRGADYGMGSCKKKKEGVGVIDSHLKGKGGGGRLMGSD